jgi:FKBP-type peptidyl-prolyl cis-trans isomerase
MASLRPFSLFVAPLALGLAVLAVGCGSGNDVTGGATGPTTLEITDLTVGTGAEAKNGDILSVHYIGSFLNGQVFESSYPGGTPFSFTLGAGRVITGWDRGIVGMRVGGKRRLVIPANLAYGSSGSGIIPPNTPLQFDVELVSIQGK